MKLIFGVLFAVIFGLAGARFAGWAANQLLDHVQFTDPDQVGAFLLRAHIGITLAIALIGAVVGVLVARALKPRVIRRDG